MNWLDLAMLGLVLLSVVIGLVRGFVQEALSLATWVLAIWLGLSFAADLAALLPAGIENARLRLIIGFAALFIVTLLAGAVLNTLAGHLVKYTGIGGTDRLLGVLFGAVRGVLVLAALAMLAELTALPQASWWREAALLGPLQEVVVWLREVLPEQWVEQLPSPASGGVVQRG